MEPPCTVFTTSIFSYYNFILLDLDVIYTKSLLHSTDIKLKVVCKEKMLRVWGELQGRWQVFPREEKRISEKEARMEIKDTFASPHNYH